MPKKSSPSYTTPLLGAHVSASGGISNAPQNAHEEGCETFQFFLSSPHTYAMGEWKEDEAEKFRAICTEFGYTQTFVHAPYLINLASIKPQTRHGSISLLRKTLERASLIGVTGVMFHTGSATGHETKEAGLKLAIESLNAILDGYTGSTKLLLENAAGAGQTLGVSFQEIGEMFAGVEHREHMGVCLDTQHAFGSGYDWRDETLAKKAFADFEKYIGFDHLTLVQVNDSKVDCGSNKDRHEHIANGKIGIEGMRNIMSNTKMRAVPWILETEPEGRAQDLKTLQKIRASL